jgi:hypothetical protein
MAFQKITAGKFNTIPYTSQKMTPIAKKILKVRLISRALFRWYNLQTCGIKDVVVKKPPINPKISCHSKFSALHKAAVLF